MYAAEIRLCTVKNVLPKMEQSTFPRGRRSAGFTPAPHLCEGLWVLSPMLIVVNAGAAKIETLKLRPLSV